MSNPLSKEIGKFEQFMSLMRDFFEAMFDHRLMVGTVFLAFCAVIGGFYAYQNHQETKMDALLSEMFSIQNQYQEKVNAIKAPANTAKDAKAFQPTRTPEAIEARAEAVKLLTAFADRNKSAPAAVVARFQIVTWLNEDDKWKESEAILMALKETKTMTDLDRARVTLELGRVLENQERWADALAHYQGAPPSQFSTSLFQMAQARCLVKLNRVDEARKVYESIEQQKEDPFAKQARGLRRLLPKGA